MKWLEREQSLLHREKQTKTNIESNRKTRVNRHGLFILQKKERYGTIATMECEIYENKNFIETIFAILFEI